MLRAISILVCASACGDSDPVPADAAAGDAATPPGADAGRDASNADGAVESALDRTVAVLASGTTSEIDALVHDLAWSDRWPLSEGDRFLFVTRSSGTPALVGDFNAWDTTRDVAARAASGTHAYAIVTIAAPAGAKYKWFEGGAYLAPAEATAYGFDENGEHGFVRPPAGGHLERFPDLVSDAMPIPRTLRFFVPAALDPERARTILFHDGQNVFHPDAPFGGWRGEVALAAHPDALAILVDNASDRFDAYTHVEDAIGGARDGGRADAYLDLIEHDVLPFARERYGVAAAGPSLAIAGSSLGGLVSIYAALARPSLASCVIGMSPTLGWGSFAPGPSPDALVHRFETHGTTAVYLDSGGAVSGSCADRDEDGVDDDADDSDNYCVTAQLRDHLEGLGYSFGIDLAHWHEPGAAHDEAAWAARLPRALESCASMGWRAP
jgi:predicted alpha/beta superfamily hydrolase